MRRATPHRSTASTSCTPGAHRSVVHEWRIDRGRTRRPSEITVRAAVAAKAFTRAADDSIHLYGAEVFGFVARVVGGTTAPRAVYSDFVDSFRKRLSRFDWSCHLRVWMYALARRECARYFAARPPRSLAAWGAPDRRSPSGDAATRSPSPFRTAAGPPTEALIAILSAEDLELLILRVDRNFTWKELAITSLQSTSFGETALAREAERLRKRFRLVKDTLARAARELGFVTLR